MRFAIEERESAIEAMLQLVEELGPLEPHVLIDTTADRTSINKSTVLAGWHHLLDTGVLRWGYDGRVTMTSTAPTLSPKKQAMEAMREHFKTNPGPVPEVQILRALGERYGLADSALQYAKHELRSTGEVVFKYADRKGCLAAGPQLVGQR